MEDKNVYNELPQAMSILTTIIVQWLNFGNEKQGLWDRIRGEEQKKKK